MNLHKYIVKRLRFTLNCINNESNVKRRVTCSQRMCYNLYFFFFLFPTVWTYSPCEHIHIIFRMLKWGVWWWRWHKEWWLRRFKCDYECECENLNMNVIWMMMTNMMIMIIFLVVVVVVEFMCGKRRKRLKQFADFMSLFIAY